MFEQHIKENECLSDIWYWEIGKWVDQNNIGKPRNEFLTESKFSSANSEYDMIWHYNYSPYVLCTNSLYLVSKLVFMFWLPMWLPARK